MNTTGPVALHDTTEQRFDALRELLNAANDFTRTGNMGAAWNARLVLAHVALQELRAEHRAGGWKKVENWVVTPESLLQSVRGCAVLLLNEGLVLRAEQRPLQPLCQRNYETVVYAVPGRGVVA